MGYSVEDITDDPEQREAAVRFLSRFDGERRPPDLWRERLAFWWDRNPFAAPELPKGWLLRHRGEVVGCFGLIAGRYSYGGREHLSMAGTTWRVDPDHRHHSLDLFLRFNALRKTSILFNSTPTERVEQILRKFRYQQNAAECHELVPLGSARFGLGPVVRTANRVAELITRPPSLNLVTLDDDFTVPPHPRQDRLRKVVTRESLRWYCNAPGNPKEFIGCVADANVLTSYLILVRSGNRRLPKLRVIDFFTTRPDPCELHALVRHVCSRREPSPLSDGCPLMRLEGPADEPFFARRRGWGLRRTKVPRRYYRLPPELQGVAKVDSVAEGDYGC